MAKKKSVVDKTTKPKKVEKQNMMNPMSTYKKDFPIPPFVSLDVGKLKEMVDLSNTYASLLQQYATEEYKLQIVQTTTKKIESKEIKPPFLVPIPGNIFIPETNMKNVLKSLKHQELLISTKIAGVRGQLEHRYDEFVETMLRFKEFLSAKLGDKQISKFTQHRTGGKQRDGEQVLFEKEFDKMTEKDGKELEELLKKATKDMNKKTEELKKEKA